MTTHVAIPPPRFARENPKHFLDAPTSMSGVTVAQAGTWTHLWLDEHRISLKKSDHAVGITKTGKKFSRYTPHSQLTLNFRPTLQVFYSFRNRGMKKIYNITSTSVTRGMGADPELTPHLLERAHFLSEAPERTVNAWIWQRIAFPLLREAPHWDAVMGMAPALRQRSLSDFTRVAFGGTRYRKDLVKAIAGAKNLNGTWLAHELKTTFPIDWLIPLVSATHHRTEEMRSIKSFMRALPSAVGKRLLTGLGDGDLGAFAVSDTLRSWSQITRLNPAYTLGDYRFTTWRDAHDHLARELGKVERAERDIPQTKLAKRLHGKTADGLTLVSPKTTWQLIDWGRDMHNCIGGYDHAAEAGSSVLFAVMRGDEMIGNMELTPQGAIRQLVGDHNRPLPTEVARTVYELTGNTFNEAPALAEAAWL